MPFCFRVCYRSVSVLFPNCNLLYFTFPHLSNTLTEFCGLRTKLILHFREICMHSFIKNCNSLSNAFFAHSACFSEQKQCCTGYPQAVYCLLRSAFLPLYSLLFPCVKGSRAAARIKQQSRCDCKKTGDMRLGFFTSGGRKFPHGNFRTTRVLLSQNKPCRRNNVSPTKAPGAAPFGAAPSLSFSLYAAGSFISSDD